MDGVSGYIKNTVSESSTIYDVEWLKMLYPAITENIKERAIYTLKIVLSLFDSYLVSLGSDLHDLGFKNY